MIRIYVKGIHGYGVDYRCCDMFSNQEYYKITIDKLGSTLYDILNRHPFTEYKIILEYNTDTSAGHPVKKDDDIVRHSEKTQRIKDKEP